VIVEALALGTPVVATDCEAGPRQILAGGRDGHLVTVGDVEAVTRALVALLDGDVRAAPDAALAPFRTETAADNYLALIDEVRAR
jgi:glycosyltransferase involved in cell wall biosynthesis